MLTFNTGFFPTTPGGVVNVNGRKLCPRIILMTDGKPTDENGRETEQVRKSDRVPLTGNKAKVSHVGLVNAYS